VPVAVNGARLSIVAGLFVAASACGAQPVAPARSHAARSKASGDSASERGSVLGPARLFPPAGRADVTGEEIDADGSRRYVAQGLRVIERPDGALEAADTWLPVSRNLRTVALPERLGGGFLFVAATSGSTLVYTAASWTGALKPLVRLDGEVEQVLPGFDRIYVMLGRGSQWIALDPASGQGVDLGSLPRSAGYGSMAFADPWFGVVVTPFRGALATFDAGATWHPLGAQVGSVAPLDGKVVLAVGGRPFALDSAGVLLPLENEGSSSSLAPLGLDKASPATAKPRPLGARPLETAVLHGYASGDGTALVAASGLLARVRLADGAVLEKTSDAYPGMSACAPVPFGAGAGFVCGEQGGRTTLYAAVPPLALRAVAEFAPSRRVASSGNGALVVSDGCARDARNPGAYCIFPRSGAPFELRVLEPGVERVVALRSGGTARLSPPRLGRPGRLGLAAPGADERFVALELPKAADKVALGIARDGLWLDSFEEGPEGELRGWAVGGGTFAGVRVKPNGAVSVGPPQQYLDRALFSSAYAFVATRAGAAIESVDGGFEWNDAELPSEPDFRPQRTSGATQGCTALGCVFSGWLRVGWGMGPRGRLGVAGVPESTRIRQPAGNRWSLDCVPTGEASRPALALPEPGDEREQSRPSPLAEVAAPVRPASERSFDAGSEPELRAFRAYAWGPPLEAWPRQARWIVRAVDPYAVDRAVWSTAPTPVPWPSPESASDAFGQSANGPPASLRTVFDPHTRAGLFIANARGTSDLFLIEEGKDIVRLKTSGATGVVSTFARAGRNSYVGALGEGQTLRVYRAEAGTLALVGEYPDVVPRADLPRLVPSTRGDGLGLWVRAGNYYLYPLDPRTGELDAPIEIPADALGAMPRACNADEDGYWVGDALSLAPRIDLYGTKFQVGNGIEVRLVVSASDVCVDGVVAPIGAAVAGTRPSPERKASPGAPLVVADPRPGGARRAFRCWD
jgi:hypothetical protein